MESFKYLGFIFNRKGNYSDHVNELNRKGRIQWVKYGVWEKDFAEMIS